MRKNPILAKPPHAFHRLPPLSRLSHKFKAEHYEGVHTTSSKTRAAGYALGACEQGELGWMVVIGIKVDGLDPLPDVDAYQEWGGKEWGLASNEADWMEILRDSELDLEAANEVFWEHEQGPTLVPGDDPMQSVFAMGQANPFQAAQEAFSDEETALQQLVYTLDPKAFQKAFPGLSEPKGGHDPNRLKAFVIDQRRYMADIHMDRIASIEVVQPWYKRITEWGDEDLTLSGNIAAQLAEKKGLQTFDIEDVYSGNVEVNTKTVFDAGLSGTIEYHGTSSALLWDMFGEKFARELWARCKASGFLPSPKALRAQLEVESAILRESMK